MIIGSERRALVARGFLRVRWGKGLCAAYKDVDNIRSQFLVFFRCLWQRTQASYEFGWRGGGAFIHVLKKNAGGQKK